MIATKMAFLAGRNFSILFLFCRVYSIACTMDWSRKPFVSLCIFISLAASAGEKFVSYDLLN